MRATRLALLFALSFQVKGVTLRTEESEAIQLLD